MYISLSLWTRDMKIFVTHVNIHERMTSAEKDLNNQVDILICSASFCRLSYVFGNKLIHRAATVVNMGSATQDSIPKDQPSVATIDCPILMYR